MNKIKVELLHITPMETIANAIANPYNKDKFRENPEQTLKTIKNICLNNNGTERHGSVLEHIVTQWEIIGSSRLELQEHMRHRIASPTVKSSRYTLKELVTIDHDFKKLFVYPPENLFKDKDSYSLFIDQYNKAIRNFINFLGSCEYIETNERLADIVKYMIPEGLRTRFTWTINLRSLLNFIRLREDKNAHFEIRHIAKLIKEKLNETYVKKLLD